MCFCLKAESDIVNHVSPEPYGPYSELDAPSTLGTLTQEAVVAAAQHPPHRPILLLGFKLAKASAAALSVSLYLVDFTFPTFFRTSLQYSLELN